jgi:hypothetical protein
MEIFLAFCDRLAERGEALTVRPHPGGQFVLKNRVELPDNVRVNNLPIFKVNLKGYRFGISAPSTILFDMVLAGIPVAVWRDSRGIMDVSNYDGLRQVSTLDDWLEFERDVRLHPQTILDRQRTFLRDLSMPTDPAEVYRRFARLIVAGLERLPRNQDLGAERRTLFTQEATFSLRRSSPGARRVTLAGNLLVEMNR